MKKIITILTACVLTVSFAAPAIAADKKKKKVPNVVRVPKGIELTTDQKTKVEALNKEFGPKLAECKAKANSIITADQKKARTESMKRPRLMAKKARN